MLTPVNGVVSALSDERVASPPVSPRPCAMNRHVFELPFDYQTLDDIVGKMTMPVNYLERQLNWSRRAINSYPTTRNCFYFNMGHCRHGSNCRFLHAQASPIEHEVDGILEDQFIEPGSLEKLELEIVEILRSRGRNPLSIASLPMVYYQKYRKAIRAEGYLTESQRHGKSGQSLTRLLSKLSSIQLIDRPHGQHAVILAEDALEYMETQKSRQIYLTFPAESGFTEEDVSHYFSTYGPVHDVRIPYQDKRMFGFVTFVLPATAQTILAKGNPHYVCGARVLVKPYKEKPKMISRRGKERPEKVEPLRHMQFVDADSELCSIPRGSRFFRGHQRHMELQARDLELERDIEMLQLWNYHRQPLLNSLERLNISEVLDRSHIPTDNFMNYSADVLNRNFAEGNRLSPIETVRPDRESDVLNQPDSPFAYSIVNSIIN